MADEQIECVDCGTEFTFTEGEQNFFQEKFGDGFNHPKRCKPCREKKKAAKGNGNRKTRRDR